MATVANICKEVKTHIQAVDSNMPTISLLKKEIGERPLVSYISIWIVNFISFLNVGKSMSIEQITLTSELIISEYPALNLADVNLVFKFAKIGRFGQIYDRIDGQIILGWFEKYFTERCQLSAERSMNESLSYKGDNSPSFEKIVELSQKMKRF